MVHQGLQIVDMNRELMMSSQDDADQMPPEGAASGRESVALVERLVRPLEGTMPRWLVQFRSFTLDSSF